MDLLFNVLHHFTFTFPCQFRLVLEVYTPPFEQALAKVYCLVAESKMVVKYSEISKLEKVSSELPSFDHYFSISISTEHLSITFITLKWSGGQT